MKQILIIIINIIISIVALFLVFALFLGILLSFDSVVPLQGFVKYVFSFLVIFIPLTVIFITCFITRYISIEFYTVGSFSKTSFIIINTILPIIICIIILVVNFGPGLYHEKFPIYNENITEIETLLTSANNLNKFGNLTKSDIEKAFSIELIEYYFEPPYEYEKRYYDKTNNFALSINSNDKEEPISMHIFPDLPMQLSAKKMTELLGKPDSIEIRDNDKIFVYYGKENILEITTPNGSKANKIIIKMLKFIS